jgi:dTDP-4-dehydrorhamnose 3,5-epimerase
VIFRPTPIPGAIVVSPEPKSDERGHFARTWCSEEFAAHGIDVSMPQASVSHNHRAGTLRGLHFARPPGREGKLVRCERGRVFDVIVDLRPESAAYLHHFAVELDEQALTALYVPPGVAHGFQTLVDGSRVLYMMSEAYRPDLYAGARHDDPVFAIRWPLPVSAIAERFLPASRRSDASADR